MLYRGFRESGAKITETPHVPPHPNWPTNPKHHYIREVFKNPSNRKIPLRGFPPPPQRTSAGQKVSRNLLAEKGGTPSPP